jgi:hypothetical protein
MNHLRYYETPIDHSPNHISQITNNILALYSTIMVLSLYRGSLQFLRSMVIGIDMKDLWENRSIYYEIKMIFQIMPLVLFSKESYVPKPPQKRMLVIP